MSRIIRLRPHHLLCIEFFRGYGYSQEFTENMRRIIGELNAASVEIAVGADELCAACPHLLDGVCESNGKTERYDAAIKEILGLTDGSVTAYTELSDRVRREVIEKGFVDDICQNCQWLYICSKEAEKYKNT